jgi:single-stranded-DNA-specific exonuclease
LLTWLDPSPTTVSPELAAVVGGHPLAAQLLAGRGFTDPAVALAFLDPRYYTPAPPEDLPDMERACERIERAIQRKERVWVWGDFDVDGQTSTALLVSVLRLMGCDPGFHIPVRASESHGMNIPNLEKIIASGADLLLTCDTGITAHQALGFAQLNGLEVIVTDHHALGDTLPPALACITPRRLPA